MNSQEYEFVKHKILKLTGIDLNSYKTAQVQRRLQVYLLRSGQPNWPKLFRAIQDNPNALQGLRDYLTINVSSFFRDPLKFKFLKESILPELLRRKKRMRFWSAGCSLGHEPYTLAIILKEISDSSAYNTILATDIDNAALAHAKAGGPYDEKDLKNIPTYLRHRYFSERTNGAYVNPTLKQNMAFRYHNLIADSFMGKFDLIICRNVVIYFTKTVKETLYKNFYEALRPGGILFLGSTEVLPKAQDLGFELIKMSFYRRPA